MPPPTTDTTQAVATNPAAALRQWAKSERKLSAWPKLHWSDTNEGAIMVDLIPNPKRYLVGEDFGVKVAMDCGEPGVHIGKSRRRRQMPGRGRQKCRPRSSLSILYCDPESSSFRPDPNSQTITNRNRPLPRPSLHNKHYAAVESSTPPTVKP